MRTLTGALLVVAGVILMAWAVNDSDPLRAELSRIFDRVPRDKPFWCAVAGTVAAFLGVRLLIAPKARP